MSLEKKCKQQNTCPICNSFKTKMLTLLEKHFNEVHGKTSQEVYDDINGTKGKKCKCGCDEEVKWYGWNKGYGEFILGHNGKIYSSYTEEEARKISEKRKQSLIGKPSWAKGLTKENDERIAERGKKTGIGRKKAFDEGKIQIWCKGKTKKDHESLMKISNRLKEVYANEEVIPWAKGLTKETSEKVLNMAQKVSMTLQNEALKEQIAKKNRLSIEEISLRIEEKGTFNLISDLSDYKNNYTNNICVECSKCKKRMYGSLQLLETGRCYHCSPGGSKAQWEVFEFIKTLDNNVKSNDRKQITLELDIFSKSNNIAIEYNGLYWHSEINKSRYYHQNKTKLCEKKGIKLFHVFEDEWRDKRDIVKSMIKHKFGLTENRIYARNCIVKKLDSNIQQSFFNDNHIDGNTTSIISYGLFDKENNLVAAISLRNTFHKTYKEYIEVGRYCTKINTHVVGGLSKLTKECIKFAKENNKKGILTYVDTRHGGNGEAYKTVGYTIKSETVSRFWWTDFDYRFNRFKYKADKKNNLTENDVAKNAKVVKIWGCKNIVLELLI